MSVRVVITPPFLLAVVLLAYVLPLLATEVTVIPLFFLGATTLWLVL